jgi:hypothetical protein
MLRRSSQIRMIQLRHKKGPSPQIVSRDDQADHSLLHGLLICSRSTLSIRR